MNLTEAEKKVIRDKLDEWEKELDQERADLAEKRKEWEAEGEQLTRSGK